MAPGWNQSHIGERRVLENKNGCWKFLMEQNLSKQFISCAKNNIA